MVVERAEPAPENCPGTLPVVVDVTCEYVCMCECTRTDLFRSLEAPVFLGRRGMRVELTREAEGDVGDQHKNIRAFVDSYIRSLFYGHINGDSFREYFQPAYCEVC